MEQLRDILIKKVITIDHDKTVQDAAKLMDEHEIGSLVIVSDEKLVGIVTERDLVRKVCTKDIASSRVPLKDVMTSPVIWAEPDLPIGTAVQRMVNNKIRRLPIVENGKLVGIVTFSDLAVYLRRKSLIEKIFE